jgi:tripartite-type tricarboxylate transporter receptor subunit TctC
MLQPGMIDETVRLIQQGMEHGVQVNVVVNNRAGGNAPLIAQQIAMKVLQAGSEE